MDTLVARIMNWKTTLMGSALGIAGAGVVTKLLADAGCDFSTISWASFAAFAFTQITGALSTDNGKTVSLVLVAFLMGGCMAPVVEVTRVGNENVEHKYSRNIWWPNWDRTVFCPELDAGGHCPNGSEKHTVTAQEAVGQSAVKGASQTAPLAAGLIFMPKAKTTQNVNGTQTQTNKNIPVFESPNTVVKP